MTPISASWDARPASATKPGVNGPTATPARRYPTSGGIRRRTASRPRTNASPSPPAIVAMSAVSSCIDVGRYCAERSEKASTGIS